MNGRQDRLTRRQRRELRSLERDLEKDLWLQQAYADLPRVPLLLRISPATYITMGVLAVLCGMFTGQGFSFLVGLSCIVYGIMRCRGDRPRPQVVDERPRRKIDPREREL